MLCFTPSISALSASICCFSSRSLYISSTRSSYCSFLFAFCKSCFWSSSSFPSTSFVGEFSCFKTSSMFSCKTPSYGSAFLGKNAVGGFYHRFLQLCFLDGIGIAGIRSALNPCYTSPDIRAFSSVVPGNPAVNVTAFGAVHNA